MDLSIYLAKVIGLYLVIVGLGLLVSRAKIISIIKDIVNHPALLFVTGILALIFGDILVMIHNIWVTDWRIVISIIGWLALIKGTIRVVLPEMAFKVLTAFMEYDVFYYMVNLITLVVGVYLLYAGFFMS